MDSIPCEVWIRRQRGLAHETMTERCLLAHRLGISWVKNARCGSLGQPALENGVSYPLHEDEDQIGVDLQIETL